MAKLSNIELLQEMVDKKYINVQKHPSQDLWIYNYTKECQAKRVWNEVTNICRGLICDNDMNIVARPFEKFFNYEEIEDKSIIPNEPFEVYEKLDGSLGIMYWVNDIPYIATRGSFVGPQSDHANAILHSEYSKYFNKLDRTKTYLFEIIYPEDAHIVRYENTDDIFLLAVIDTETGQEDNINNWSNIFKCVLKYDGVTDFTKVRDLYSGTNREGFVIKFTNNFRVKMKYESYFRLHYLRTFLTDKTILEYVSTNNENELLDKCKDIDEESMIYLNNSINKFKALYELVEKECKEYLDYINRMNLSKELTINMIKGHKYSGVIFKMWKGQNYFQCVWSYVKKIY